MKIIRQDDRYYGEKRLQHKIDRLKQRLSYYDSKELSSYGHEELGGIREALNIYEDMLDHWDSTQDAKITDNIRDILQGTDSLKDKQTALDAIQQDLNLAYKVLSGDYKYCKECNRYYLTKSFQHVTEKKDVQICTYEDPINSGGNEYTSGVATTIYEVCPCGHKYEICMDEQCSNVDLSEI